MKSCILCAVFILKFCESSEAVDHSEKLLRQSAVGGSAIHDCDGVGCTADVSPVCANGITFQNECLAFCQKFKSIMKGPCKNQSGIELSLGSGSTESVESVNSEMNSSSSISPEAMNRYAAEGFFCIGTCGFYGSPKDIYEPIFDPPLNEMGFPKHEKPSKEKGMLEAFRVSYDGYAYFSTFVDGDKASRHESNRHKGRKLNSVERRESIIGIDTRMQVKDTGKNPHNKIGEIDYEGKEGGCSGAVVDKNSFLTAAHCIFNLDQQQFYPVRWFAPGRPRKGQLQDSDYRWKAKDATIYRTWVDTGNSSYDLAIVRVHQNEVGKKMGEVVGTLELKSYRCAVDPFSQVIGYPGDKTGSEDGMQFTSGKCDAWSHSCNSKRVYHQCDTYGGNSGSPCVDSSLKIAFGVHTHGAGGGNWNSAVAIQEDQVNTLNTWME